MTDDRPAIRPRIRTAAIVWGLILAALGGGLLWAALDPRRIVAAGLRVVEAGPADVVIGVVGLLLAAGVAIVVGSLLRVLHRAQDRARRDRETPAPKADGR